MSTVEQDHPAAAMSVARAAVAVADDVERRLLPVEAEWFWTELELLCCTHRPTVSPVDSDRSGSSSIAARWATAKVRRGPSTSVDLRQLSAELEAARRDGDPFQLLRDVKTALMALEDLVLA